MKENNDGTDTDVGSIENSIEEDIKIVEKLINTMKSDRTMFEEDKSKEIYTFFINSLEHILSDYKRILKENEKYKRLAEMNLKNAEEFKDNMCEHRCLLKNENEELKQENEQLRTEVNSLKKENDKLKFEERSRIIGKYGYVEIHDVINRVLSNDYISVKKVKNMIKEKEWALENYNCDESDFKQSQAIGAWDILQKLLKESEE